MKYRRDGMYVFMYKYIYIPLWIIILYVCIMYMSSVKQFITQFVNIKNVSIELFHVQTIRFYVYDYAELNKS